MAKGKWANVGRDRWNKKIDAHLKIGQVWAEFQRRTNQRPARSLRTYSSPMKDGAGVATRGHSKHRIKLSLKRRETKHTMTFKLL